MKTTLRNARLTLTLAATLAALSAPRTASAQELPATPDRSARAEQDRCAPPWTALGIGRISCNGCSLSWGRGVRPEAHFGTEPEVFPMSPRVSSGDAVRSGDRLVAVDGQLITTAAGSERLVGVREGDRVTLTVRREGRTRELLVVAGDACEVELPPLPEAPPAPRAGSPREPAPAPLPVPGTTRPGEPVPSPLPSPPSRRPAEPMPPAAPAPLPAPPAPGELLPNARLGFGFSCGPCGFREGSWWFESPPTVSGVERGGPAWDAGLRTGDEIVAIGGQPLTSEAGARAFGAIEPGDRVRWRVRRDNRVQEVTLTATEKPERRAPAPPSPERTPASPARGVARAPGEALPSLTSETLRYQGRLGGTDVEVRGAPVSVTVDETTGEVVIRTSDAVVRLTRVGGGG